RVRHRIKSAFRKWPTTAQAFQRQPCAATRAVQIDRFLRVVGTRRIEFAGSAQKWRKEYFVELDECQQRPLAESLRGLARMLRRYCGAFALAGISFSRSACNAENSCVAAELRG